MQSFWVVRGLPDVMGQHEQTTAVYRHSWLMNEDIGSSPAISPPVAHMHTPLCSEQSSWGIPHHWISWTIPAMFHMLQPSVAQNLG